ncbi:DUF1761 domain-containing protein [Sulfidibacter corallicola]|uniref:DUF1761 domain-containing protein n=1 Tax=Sulfidibacter corallicola TaxID=2818388 RepID=A0A8A4TMW9_SULCO|nr:DUF1761 domain-containing protein [Sulfidibacter corallicola]QTD51316.1 DUF1761 domain-containing protein [Sulfidibacter corallicola]
METLAINHAAVWVLVVVHQLVPPLWYSNLLFAKPWMKLQGLKAEDFSSTNPVIYLVPLGMAVLTCYATAWLFRELSIDSAAKGAMMGALFALAFVFADVVSKDMFSLRPLQLTLINQGLNLVLLVITGAVLGAWTRTMPAS